MGTRGTYGFRKDGRDKVTYNHWDSYPAGLGEQVVRFCRTTSVEEMREIFDRIVLVEEDAKPSPEQRAQCTRWIAHDVRDQQGSDWYSVLRGTMGDLSVYKAPDSETVLAGMAAAAGFLVPDETGEGFTTLDQTLAVANGALLYMIDSSEFIKDSLFCEHSYIINLDSGKLEYWKGFQAEPQPGNRYGDTVPEGWKPEYDGQAFYYPCALLGEWPLQNLPVDILDMMGALADGHKPGCPAVTGEGGWSGSPLPEDPDDYWICDDCGGIVSAKPDTE